MYVSPFATRKIREPISAREFVIPPKKPHSKSGFTPRAIEKLATTREPVTSLSMECRHRDRIEEDVPYAYYPSVELRLWKEAGKFKPPFPDRPDDNFNFSVWRNFKSAFGLQLPPNRQNSEQHEMLAACYPVSVPKPSHMDEHSFARYIDTCNQFTDSLQRQTIVRRLREENRQRKRLALLAATRNPPLDEQGHILPPKGYRRYQTLLLQPGVAGENPEPEPEITEDMEPDLFGKLMKKRPQHQRLWKLSYKSTNPKYNEAMQFAKQRREGNFGDGGVKDDMHLLPVLGNTPAPPMHSMRCTCHKRLFTMSTSSTAPLNCTGNSDWYSTELKVYLAFIPFCVHLSRVLIPIWICIGVPGSAISLIVWSRQRLWSSSSVYLCSLAVLDIGFLTCQQIPWHLASMYDKKMFNNEILCNAFPVFSFCLQYLSPLLTLAFTVERWVSVCHPFASERLCTAKRAMIATGLMTSFCTLFSLVQLKFYKFSNGQCGEDPKIFDTSTFEHKFYSVWSKSTEVLFFAIVPIAILVFNIMVLQQARKHRQQLRHKPKSSATTFTLLSISFYQIGAVLPVTLLLFIGLSVVSIDIHQITCNLTKEETVEQLNHDGLISLHKFLTYSAVNSVIGTLAVSHYAMKFFIYFITGHRFRQEFGVIISNLLPCRTHENFAAQMRTNSDRRRRRRLRRLRSCDNENPVQVNGKDMDALLHHADSSV